MQASPAGHDPAGDGEHRRREQPPREREADEARRDGDELLGRRVQHPPTDGVAGHREPRDAAEAMQHEHRSGFTGDQRHDEGESDELCASWDAYNTLSNM